MMSYAVVLESALYINQSYSLKNNSMSNVIFKLLPLFVMDILADNNPGFPGFFVAGVFSGALSTVSGGLNSLAAVTLEDFIKPFYDRISGR